MQVSETAKLWLEYHKSLCLVDKSQGEANGVFTLINFEISLHKVKISST